MSGTSSEYQRGYADGAEKRDPVSLADARAESYRKGWEDAIRRATFVVLKRPSHKKSTARLLVEIVDSLSGILHSPTAPQAPSQPPAPPKTPEPATVQHNGSQMATLMKPTQTAASGISGYETKLVLYQENDDGA